MTHITSAFTTSYFAVLKLNGVNSSSLCTLDLCRYLAPWLVGLRGMVYDDMEACLWVRCPDFYGDQVKLIESVVFLWLKGGLHNGDLADCVDQEKLGRNGEL